MNSLTHCDVLYKMRYILRVAAQLGTCDITRDGRHLGIFPKLEIIMLDM